MGVEAIIRARVNMARAVFTNSLNDMSRRIAGAHSKESTYHVENARQDLIYPVDVAASFTLALHAITTIDTPRGKNTSLTAVQEWP